jgi:hypothetical protein
LLVDADGRSKNIAIRTDITVRAAEAVRMPSLAELAASEFLANMSHNRTPMNDRITDRVDTASLPSSGTTCRSPVVGRRAADVINDILT